MTVDEIMDMLAAKAASLPDDSATLSVSTQKRTAWTTESVRLRDRLAQHRRDCREAIRRANRDTLISTTLQCYRSDLLQDINWLREHEQYVAATPFANPDLLASVSAAIASLTDAQSTIVDGIDANVFGTIESLEQAKGNLRTNYREPYWFALMKWNADRELTYLYFIAKKLYDLSAKQALSGVSTSLRDQTIRCLDAAHGPLLNSIEATDHLTASASLKTAQETIDGCIGKYRAFVRSLPDPDEEKTEETDS
jgi:hypothetical protein